MSGEKWNRTKKQSAPRLGFDAYQISQKRYLELRNGCATGKYRPELLSKACATR